jgi:hypothetical protein
MKQQNKVRERFQTEIIESGSASNKSDGIRICLYTGQPFKPKSQRQIFINEDARIKFNNDKRAKIEKEKNMFLSKVNNNERILKEGYSHLSGLGKKSIGKDALQFSGYDFSTCTSVTLNQATGLQIYWAINYGIEESKKEIGVYIISKKY